MSYAIRTHKPETSKKAAEYFDQEIEKFWAEFAEIIADDVNRLLAALPVRYGGCGLTRCSPLREAAYEASVRAANGELGESQRQSAERYNREVIARLDQDKIVKQHRDDVKVDQNSSWFTQSKDSDPKAISTLQSSALLRSRLATPHRTLVIDEKSMVECPGCKRKTSQRAINQHLRGCTRIRGQNASQAHAIAKKRISDYATGLGIHSEAKEPDFTIVKCPSCNKFVDVMGPNWAENHCGGICNKAELEAARRLRPDNRYITQKITAVTDYSFTGCIEPKNSALGEAAQKKLKARARVKDGNYKERVEAAGEIFYPVVSTCNGTLGEAAIEFLKLLYDNRNKENELLTFRQLTSDMKRIVHSVSAGALINAERVAGATHLRQVNTDEGDLPWDAAFHTSHLEHDDETAHPNTTDSTAPQRTTTGQVRRQDETANNRRPSSSRATNAAETAATTTTTTTA